MTRLDRYILRQLVVAFGFFALVFTGVVWLTQSVRLIDTIVASGQGGRILLEFSALVLPQVLVVVLPLSAMGAGLSALNRLYSESELVAMMSAGVGPGALLRPTLAFGALVGALMALVLNVLVPLGGAELARRTQEIRSDLARGLIVERQFLHPMAGLTLFIAETGRAGEMGGIFLHDQRDPDRPVTYSAEAAQLLREGDEARLVMVNGVALGLSGVDQLASVDFDQFVFDLSDLVQPPDAREPRPSEYGVRTLLDPTPAMLARSGRTRGDFVAEGHAKLSLPVLAATYPAIALVTLLAGGYRRSGFGRRVVVAVGVAVVLHGLAIVTKDRTEADDALWPVMYLPIALAALYVAVLLRRLRRAAAPRRVAA